MSFCVSLLTPELCTIHLLLLPKRRRKNSSFFVCLLASLFSLADIYIQLFAADTPRSVWTEMVSVYSLSLSLDIFLEHLG